MATADAPIVLNNKVFRCSVIAPSSFSTSRLEQSLPYCNAGVNGKLLENCWPWEITGPVGQALVIPLRVIVLHELLNGLPQGCLPEENYAVQSGLLDTADKPLRVRVQVRRLRWQLDRLHARRIKRLQELRRERWIPVVDQAPLAREQSLVGVGEVPGDLAHPETVDHWRNAGDLHFASRQFD